MTDYVLLCEELKAELAEVRAMLETEKRQHDETKRSLQVERNRRQRPAMLGYFEESHDD